MSDLSTILLIGAGGLVGRQLRLALPDADTIPTFHRNPSAAGLQLDITDHDAVRRTIQATRPSVIVLAAADAYVDRCERESDVTRGVNIDAPRVIAAEAKAAGALLVVFSSEYVFDGTAGRYAENDERRPINEYGRQKVELEDLALATGRGLVCRTSGVFGPDPHRKNFVYQLTDRLRSGNAFDVASDQLITPTYAEALALAVTRLVEQRQTGIFHVAGPQILSRIEFARLVTEAYDLPTNLIRARRTSELGLAAPRPHAAGLSTEKLAGTLGWQLLKPVEALLAMAQDT